MSCQNSFTAQKKHGRSKGRCLSGAYGAASTYEQSLSRKDNENYFYHTTETFFYQKEEWEAGQSKANARGTQNNKLVANAVMIDTEEKVVRPNLQ